VGEFGSWCGENIPWLFDELWIVFENLEPCWRWFEDFSIHLSRRYRFYSCISTFFFLFFFFFPLVDCCIDRLEIIYQLATEIEAKSTEIEAKSICSDNHCLLILRLGLCSLTKPRLIYSGGSHSAPSVQ
jgi:hypothetical protein